MTRTPLWWLPIVLGAILCVPAQAGSFDPQQRADLIAARHARLKQKWEADFRAADTSADRRLTREEARAAHLPDALLEHFDDIDADHDGALTPEELLAVYERRLASQHAGAADAETKTP